MKKTIIYLIFLLLVGSIQRLSAQEYKYFDLLDTSQYIVWYSPKELTYLEKSIKGGKAGGYQIKMNQAFFETFTPIFKEVFGYPDVENKETLSKIRYVFYFRKDFKSYYFFVSYPADRRNEFPDLEEKIYRFGKKSMQANFQSFVDVWDKEVFQGSSFDVGLGSLYDFLNGKISLETLKLMY